MIKNYKNNPRAKNINLKNFIKITLSEEKVQKFNKIKSPKFYLMIKA